MDAFKLHDQIEDLLRELGVDAPAEEEEVEAEFLCAMCGLGEHFTNIENEALRQCIESAPSDVDLGNVRLGAQRNAVVAVAAAAMELALANPEWADRLLSQLPFDRERMQNAASTIRSSFIV